MTIPLFPEFRDVDLTMRQDIGRFLSRYQPETSEYTFTNIFAHRKTYDFRVSVHDDNLIILRKHPPASLFCPIGDSPDLRVLFDFLKRDGVRPCMERVPESFVRKNLADSERYEIEEERDHFDYLYDIQELIELRGRKFHGQKNKINKFRKDYVYAYETMTANMVEECIAFEDEWCEVKDCEQYYGLERERCAVLTMLKHFGPLQLKGGVIRIDGRIKALTFAEEYLPETLVIHVEKANPDIPGLYQAINQEFLMHEAGACRMVNREQDLGIENLRRAKMSYHPVGFFRKYKITEKMA